jgi:IclR family transcriptional regulator, KDG regulon repressor
MMEKIKIPALNASADAPDEHETSEKSGQLIQSVVTATEILESLASAAQPVRLTALAKQLGETKAKMHRHLSTLKSLGFVDQDSQTECYRLGPKLVHLGQAATDQFDLRRLAEPYMVKLRDLTHQTVVLSMPANGDAIVNAVLDSPNMVTISVRLGYRLPAHASAQGRVTLAYAPAAIQQRILTRKLSSFTPRTMVDAAALRRRLDKIRQQFYEVAMDETLLGISAVAAPVMNFDGDLVGAIAIVGTTQYVHEPVEPEQLKFLRACAKAMSLKLNSSAYEGHGVPSLKEFIFD